YFRVSSYFCRMTRGSDNHNLEKAVSLNTCRYWFKCFQNSNFDVNNRSRFEKLRKLEVDELQTVLHENSAQTQEELAEQLRVTRQTI
ncbi:hypothetical protein EAI_17406, partial [Harpegnathos saltator]